VLVQRLMESTDTELDQSMAKLISLGLALLYLNKQEKADAMVEAVKTIEHSIGKFTEVVLEGCAYAATGNVLKVQKVSACAVCFTYACTRATSSSISESSVTLCSSAL
jgi:26S proteasome regulatory subunit N1